MNSVRISNKIQYSIEVSSGQIEIILDENIMQTTHDFFSQSKTEKDNKTF